MLVRLNGESVPAKTMRDIRQQLRAMDEAEVTLELWRAETLLNITFRLRKVL